jgi:excisionase family DNA binding protein
MEVPMSADGRLSIDGGAAVLGVSRFTLRKWLRERRLPYHKVGRRIVLDRADLERFLRACRVEARHPSIAT